jgi:iron complex transport system substrate-binding protein
MKTILLLTLLAITIPANAARTLTDETGHQVTLPDHPHRIVSLVPSLTDDLFALGAADDVVAVSDYTEFPAEATRKPRVGSITNPSLETILNLHPDLILGTPKFNQKSILDQLQRLGIPIYLIDDPHGLPGILTSIISVGHATNRDAQATAVVASLQQRLDRVRAFVAGKPIVSVMFPVWYDPAITIGKGAFITDIIVAAGGRSITDDIAQEWPHVSIEAIVSRAPQALLLVRNGKMTLDLLSTRPGWADMPAVKNRRAYYVDKRINLPSPVAIDALEDLAKQFHP